MSVQAVWERYRAAEAELNSPAAPLLVRDEGLRLVFWTGTAYVRRTRILVRAGGMLALAAGATAGALFSPWGWLAAPVGLLLAALAPGQIRAARLLEIDTAAGRLTPTALAPELSLPLDRAARLRGVYETQGWDPRTVIDLVFADGTTVPVLIFPGTDERLAEYACRTLGQLLGCPATYKGPFGGETSCYTPPPEAHHPLARS
ncbi:MAG: hypothetical protein ACK47B_17845 [Armatimonadota bacterium]